MAFTSGDKKADINVTPMIDVLLVLLIIFMVVVQHDAEGLEAKVPKKPEDKAAPSPPSQDVVITVRRDGGIDINLDPIAAPEVESRLRALYAMRGDRVIFVRALEELEFATVAHVIDTARGVGLTQIALMRGDEP